MTSVFSTIAHLGALAGAPLTPDAPDARDLVRRELAHPRYAEAQPTWFDLLSQSVVDWFLGLFESGVSGPPGLGLVIVLLVIGALVAVAIAVYGIPARRAKRAGRDDLFGDSDARSARDMRRDAEAAAARGDWASAIADRYRAIARSLDERTIVTVHPGTTAHGFARLAARAYPDAGGDLERAADAFDGVRYLGRAGTPDAYGQLRDLDTQLSSRPSPVAASASGRSAGATAAEVPR
ncbi:MAG TPA: DUF4129 domain-containing protein [Microcella sp.]|nr:DUF4129 domain-containing protein [Microcella sp.]